MMPQRRDLSRQKMKAAVAELLLTESLATITVQQIVQTAEVSRSTFYRNFDDKADFMHWLQVELVRETTTHFAATAGIIGPNFEVFYDYAMANRKFLQAFMTGRRWPELEEALYAHAFARYAKLLRGQVNRLPVRTLTAFVVGGHVNMFLDWLRSPDPEAPAAMARYHHQLGRALAQSSLHSVSD